MKKIIYSFTLLMGMMTFTALAVTVATMVTTNTKTVNTEWRLLMPVEMS